MLEIYTINPITFAREVLLDEFESVIWTERYIEPGDVKLTLPATRERIKLLAPGGLLELKTSDDPMLLDTRGVEDGILTVSGKTVEAYFNERNINAFKSTGRPGVILGRIVQKMQRGSYPVPGVRLGSLDTSDDVRTIPVPLGPVHDSLLDIAKTYKVGMTVSLVRKSTYNELVFSTRAGVDLTSVGPNSEVLVRFSPELQNLANVKELTSVADHKSMIVAYPPKSIPWLKPWDPYVYRTIPNFIVDDNPFVQRIMVIHCDDITEDMLGRGTKYSQKKTIELGRLMRERARLEIAKHKRTNIVDGEVPPEGLLKYKKDYKLGDRVEMEGHFGSPVFGTVTEYIQSSDNTGERAYPTVVVGADEIIDDDQ